MDNDTSPARVAALWEAVRLRTQTTEPAVSDTPCRATIKQPIRGFPPIVWRCCHAGPHDLHQSRGFDHRVLKEWQ